MFNILGYWLRWLFKCSKLPTPGVLVKHINIGAQGLGSEPGPVKSDTALPTAVCHHFEGSWESKLYCTGANKVTVAEMGPATRYTLLRITVSIIKFDLISHSSNYNALPTGCKKSRPLKLASCIS